MEIKSIISIAVMLIISSNVFAWEGQGVKILSESFTHTPGMKNAHIEPIPLKKNSVFLAAAARSIAYNTNGRPNEFIPIKGDHFISISNTTNISQRYRYTYKLICDKENAVFTREIELAPHGIFNDSSRSFGVVQEQVASAYQENVRTRIVGSSAAYDEAHALVQVRWDV